MSCVIVNKSNLSSKQLVEKLFANEKIEEGDESFIWNVENRYYSAKVILRLIKEAVPMETFNVGASIYFVESFETDDHIESLRSWKKAFTGGNNEEDEPEVQLIVAEKFLNEDLKSKVLDWSLENSVELIDMSEDYNEDLEGVHCYSNTATKRISEALQTCLWSNYEQKNKDVEEDDIDENNDDNFETLFSQLVNFRESAGDLPDSERRAFAEKIALAFYSSINSDDEDI